MIVKNKFGIRIVSTGHYVPPKMVTNDDMSRIVDTSDEWISTRTGIKNRHFCVDEDNADLAVNAAMAAIRSSGIDINDIGVCIVATFSPDYYTPSTACIVQKRLGLPSGIPCFDINAACSGYLYGLGVMRGMLLQSDRTYGLLIASEVISKVLDFTDRESCILFGDGAGAALIELTDSYSYESVLGADGDWKTLYCHSGDEYSRKVRMDGRKVFKFAVAAIPESINSILEKTGLTLDNIDYIVCHQANRRIIEYVADRLQQPIEKFYINIQKYGNTSAASIGIALDEMNRNGMLERGDRIICVGFGAGFTWGAAYIEW